MSSAGNGNERRRRGRGGLAWELPVAGGTLVTVVVVLWYTAALWYFNGFQLPHL